jgi:5-epi-alpha-selinene synthase
MEDLVLPALYCPFPSAVNRHAAAVQDETLAWVRHFQLVRREAAYQRFHAAKFGWLAARAYPRADFDELALVSAWNVWLFMLDDQCDEGGIGKDPEQLRILFAGLLDILRRPSVDPAPGSLASSLHDLWRRMSARATAAWRHRFTRDAGDYFTACLWEATNRAEGRTPSVRDYIAQRPLTGGLITDVDLIDLTEHIDLPDDVRAHAVLQRLTSMANNVVCWSNDIISLEKELRHGDVHNLVLAIQHERRCDLREAVDHAATLHDDEVRGFLTLERQIPSWGAAIDRDLARYVSVLRSWMRGNLDWAHETGRYRPPEGAHADTSASSLEALADDHRIFAWDDEDAAAAPASSHPAREVPPPAFHAPRPEPIRPWASDRTQ